MKYLLVLAVVLVAFYIWRNNRAADAREHEQAAPPPRPAPPTAPDAMVTCRHCGLHLPSQDAVKGTLGYYCGHEHRRLAEG